ncbi:MULTISPECIES: ArnT family glycosyltransferase [unclassified Micromonospora]|uniref:ArnT family glycosyltransferase n=1 Tax=unclassified Micromonospora TaxID=2617518 RepID=UPI00363B6423
MAAALGLAGVLYRVILLALDVPPANSDEGTAGLAALHIGEGRHWPTFFYGQDYMGTFYSYLAAPLIQVLGTHWWVLRLPALAMYAVFLLLVFRLTRTLYTPWFAVFVMAVMAFGSDRVIKDQMIGAGGYSDVATAVAGLMLASALLALEPDKRRTMFAVWGLLAGYIVWTHWLALPYVVVAALLVAWVGRSVLTLRWVSLAVFGFLLGAAPLIWFNLHHANSLSVLLSLSGATEPAAWPDRWYGAVLLGLPLSSGMCAPSHCATWQMWWGPAYLILMVVAAVVALVAIRRADLGERRVQAGRLALLAGAALTLAAYVASSASAVTPIESARYLHYAMVSLPAVLWPLWGGLTSLAGRAGVTASGGEEATRESAAGSARRGVIPAVGCVALVGALIASLLVATAQLGAYQSHYADKADEERQLLDRLRAAALTHVYSEYWTCNRLAYRSAEQVRCAVLDEDLAPGFDRYRPYRDQVRQAERVAYVLPESSVMAGNFARSTPAGVEVISLDVVAGYRVYLCRQSPKQD